MALIGRKLASWQRQYAEEEDVANPFGSGTSGAGRNEWQQMKAEFQNAVPPCQTGGASSVAATTTFRHNPSSPHPP